MTDFIRITNKDIYNRINHLFEENQISHNKIIKKQDITNGKVKLNRWLGTTALTLVLLLLGYFISYLGKV